MLLIFYGGEDMHNMISGIKTLDNDEINEYLSIAYSANVPREIREQALNTAERISEKKIYTGIAVAAVVCACVCTCFITHEYFVYKVRG